MQITNLQELLQALGAKKVFKADGTLTKQAEKAYDKLVNIRFAMQGPVPEDTKTVRYEVFKGCPNCMGDEYLMEI